MTTPSPAYGALVPYGDPTWYQGLSSPYYKQTHVDFRAKVRDFVEKELMPHVHTWDEEGTYPHDLHKKAYDAGILAAIWPAEYGGTPPPDFDAFHDFILHDELARCGGGGILWAVFLSFGISLPPVINWGTQEMRDRVARRVITGDAIMALAVSEPYAGSDVAGLRTTADLSPCGKFFIVNGEKKFITSGIKATFYTVAVRTGKGKGVSLLLMEKGMPGLTARRMKTQGWLTSNTAYLVFENVKVPVSNLIGKENEGFKYIMYNFNHERFVLATTSNRFARVCLEEAFEYARLRKAFGKTLLEQPVIRQKIGEMSRQVEATHSLLEQVAYQMKSKIPDDRLGGLVALAKVQATKTFEFCAREASQILGGNSCIRGGRGDKVERLYREVRTNAIGGGSEEILLDLAVRLGIKMQTTMTKKAKL
eukprot:TRINITY_DN8630_c0_g1_i3.p1 TRINITY_DN8630_c0_g1~~TRINITY_DN8630_c0_g1_i3.p1  ORF type:complete len:443 (+),score=72.91 TRINITY_DN8630_c0_g1_i3:66-1331(+)